MNTNRTNCEATAIIEFYGQMASKALEELRGSFPDGAWMVSGPIGDGEQIAANIALLSGNIDRQSQNGLKIWSQIPYHASNQPEDPNNPHLKMECFYKVLLESGCIKGLIMTGNWRASYGANYEHDCALRLGLEIVYL